MGHERGGHTDDIADAIGRRGIVGTHQAYRAAHPELRQSHAPVAADHPDEIEDQDEDADTARSDDTARIGENILSPPDFLESIREEWGEFHDVCPYPRPAGYDALKVPWRADIPNYMNCPFIAGDETGPMDFLRKAIAEQARGCTTIGVISSNSRINLLIEAGAELRSAGRPRWLNTATGKPMGSPPPCVVFVLRGIQPDAAT